MLRTLTELQDLLAHKIMSCDDIVKRADKDKRVLAADEQEAFDGLQAEIEKLKTEIEATKQTNARRDIVEAQAKMLKEPEDRLTTPENPGAENDRLSGTHVEIPFKRFSKLEAFTNDSSGHLKAYRSGMWLRAQFLGDEGARRYCHNHGVGRASLALGESVNTAGGALVPDEFNQAIIDLKEEFGVFRREVEIMPMGRDVMFIPRRTGGVTATFIAENSSISESDPTWNNIQLTAQKLAVMTRMSTELDEDAVINMADWIAREFAYAFAVKEDDIGFTGDGTNTDGNVTGVNTLFNNDNTLAGAVDTVTANADTFAELALVDFTTLMAALPAYAHRTAKWYCSQVCYDIAMARILAAGGGNTIRDLEGGFQQSFLGFPVVISQTMPLVTTTLDNVTMLLFGDLRLAAILGDRRGIAVRRSDERFFDTDQIALKATERIDVNVHGTGDGTTAGPIVALIGVA